MQEIKGLETMLPNFIDTRDFGDGRVNAIMSALHFQHKLFLREMQDKLLPVDIPLNKVQTVCDFVCGPGSWCIDFSREYPDKHICGLDINQSIIQQARENAAQASMENLEFYLLDKAELSAPFEGEKFDLIHLQNGTNLFSLQQWPAIMSEIFRLLKPGGWLNLVDFEMGPTSEPALDRTLALLGQILKKLDRNISPNGLLPMTGCVLGPQRLSEHAFTDIDYHLYPVNLGGWNNPMGRAYLTSMVVRPEMILRLAVKTEIGKREELEPLMREMLRELQQIGFCGIGMILSTFGRKPLPSSEIAVQATRRKTHKKGK
jgi:ubiquinone/menaquinone biosynthesis C-methylase UbiE